MLWEMFPFIPILTCYSDARSAVVICNCFSQCFYSTNKNALCSTLSKSRGNGHFVVCFLFKTIARKIRKFRLIPIYKRYTQIVCVRPCVKGGDFNAVDYVDVNYMRTFYYNLLLAHKIKHQMVKETAQKKEACCSWNKATRGEYLYITPVWASSAMQIKRMHARARVHLLEWKKKLRRSLRKHVDAHIRTHARTSLHH